jgi:hypothetical protein
MSVEKSFLVSKALRGFDEIDAIVKADDNRARNAGRLAMVPVVGGYAASGYAASQAKEGRKAAVGGRTFGRGTLTATGAALPGLGVSLHGMHRGSAKQVLAGQALSLGGALAGSSHGARNAVRNAQRRGDLITKAAKKRKTASRANTDRYTGEYIQSIANRAQAQRNMGRGLLAGGIGATVLGAPAAGAALGTVGAGSLIASHANHRRLQNLHDSILIARQHGR